MKASDSANSLSELVRDDCFICLDADNNSAGEPVVSSKILRNCGCKFFVHPRCWNEWMKDKTDWDCPICHKQSVTRIPILPNPVLAIVITEEFQMRSISKLACGIFIFFVIAFVIGMTVSEILK